MENHQEWPGCDEFAYMAVEYTQEFSRLLLESDGKPGTFDAMYGFVAGASLMLYDWANMLQHTVLLHDEGCLVNMLQAKAVLERLAQVWRTSMDANRVIHLLPQNRETIKVLLAATQQRLSQQPPSGWFCSGTQNLN